MIASSEDSTMDTSCCARSSAARRACSALSLAMPKPSWRASVSATSISGSVKRCGLS